MDPLFLFFQGNLPSDYEITEEISDLSLNPVLTSSVNEDDLTRAFNMGGSILANLDSIFNFSDTPRDLMRHMPYTGKTLADISTGPRGGSEYWLWRNAFNQVITRKDVALENFRSDIDLGRVQDIQFDEIPGQEEHDSNRISKWGEYSNFPFNVVGSTDVPRNLTVFLHRLQTVIDLSNKNTWFFLALPDDRIVEEILNTLKPFTQQLTSIRIISSRFPWVVGLWKDKMNHNVLNYERKGPTKKFKLPLERDKFYDFKRAALIWKIPFSLPESV